MIANIGNSTVVGLFSENQDQAVLLWLTISTVQEALGGGNEIVGGLWVLLLSWVALRSDKLPKVLNYLGVLVGLAGILTVVPAFELLMVVFGLGQIVWFAWLGIVMLRETPSAT
jgi:prepilin signal peptidase PulO-like enzyme (type II secretory pathway)